MARKSEDDCPICGEFMEILVRAYADAPFIDGKKYDGICHCCSSVPKTWFKYEEDVVECGFDVSRLNSLQELMEFGFDKVLSQRSLKSVQRCVSKSLGSLDIGNDSHIFDNLLLDSSLVFDLISDK